MGGNARQQNQSVREGVLAMPELIAEHIAAARNEPIPWIAKLYLELAADEIAAYLQAATAPVPLCKWFGAAVIATKERIN